MLRVSKRFFSMHPPHGKTRWSHWVRRRARLMACYLILYPTALVPAALVLRQPLIAPRPWRRSKTILLRTGTAVRSMPSSIMVHGPPCVWTNRPILVAIRTMSMPKVKVLPEGHGSCGQKTHIPSDFVVAYEASEVESRSCRAVWLLHKVWTTFCCLIRTKITLAISMPWSFTTSSGGIWL